MKIIGGGLLASAFNDEEFNENVTIFASGVSNSLEQRPEEFLRETILLKKEIDLNNQLIYFSTCSLYLESYTSMYTSHKLEMEALILNKSVNNIVIRLPQVVGNSNNKNTLLNYLSWKVYHQNEFILKSGTLRNIIDIDDIPFLLRTLLNTYGVCGGLFNFATPISVDVAEIVKCIEVVLNKKAKFILDPQLGYAYPVSDFMLKDEISNHINYDEGYIIRLIKKYYNDFPNGFK